MIRKSQKDIMLKVVSRDSLLNFLLKMPGGRSRKTIKSLLSHNMIRIDGKTVSQFDHPLIPGQTVTISSVKDVPAGNIKGLDIIYEDEHIIIINKEAGLLSVAATNEKKKTAYRILSDFLKKSDPGNKIFAVHRLDKDTSGVMMYAKNAEVRDILQDTWDESVIDRIYIAIVEGHVEKQSGKVISWLKENKNLVMYSSPVPGDGLKSVTCYKVTCRNKNYSMLELRLETGRKNQIRVHMKDFGHRIIGDVKYGSLQNPINRLGLHALILSFIHPVTKKIMRFETEIPGKFRKLFEK